MKIGYLPNLLFLFFAISGCQNDDSLPIPLTNCQAEKFKFTSIAVSVNDTTYRDIIFSYDASGRIIKVYGDDPAFGGDLYEYDSEGRLIKSITVGSSWNTEGADNWKYKYDNAGRLIEKVYGYGNMTYDSSSYEHISSTLIKQAQYKYQPKDTIHKTIELNTMGTHVKVYSDEFYKPTPQLSQEFEYYDMDIPGDFVGDPSPTYFGIKKLLKKYTWYGYYFNGSQLVNNYVHYELYTYTFDDQGRIIQYIQTRDTEGDSKDIVDVIYKCQ